MSNTNTYRVKVKSTGKIITVYKLFLGGYCSANDHTTSYAESNLIFLEENTDIEEVKKINNGGNTYENAIKKIRGNK